MYSMLCRWATGLGVQGGSGALLTALRGALPPCDAPSRELVIPVTRAAVQAYPQVREERGPAVPSHEVAEDGAGAASWSNTAQAALDTSDRCAIRTTGCAALCCI